MTESELKEVFLATNTAEPLSEGWQGLLRFGLAVAAAEREACAKVCDLEAAGEGYLSSEEGLAIAEHCASLIRGTGPRV